MEIRDATPLWAHLDYAASRVKKMEQLAHDLSRLTLHGPGPEEDSDFVRVPTETLRAIIDRAKEAVGG